MSDVPEEMGDVPEEVTEAPVEKFSSYVVGIDLGTTNSVIAVYKKGRPEILEVEGRVFTPSVVSFVDDGKVLVGESAKRRTLLDPEKTIASIKSEMADPDWKFAHGGKEYTPTDIASIILGKLKEGAQGQNKIDLGGTVEKAVICIPANFDSNKREETRKAGELVGLKVLHLLEEPQAAAIAYGFERKTDTDATLLIYDLGGGTFDVCILHVLASKDPSKPNEFRVLAKEGIPDLGGDKFDWRIMEMLRDTLKESSDIDVLDAMKDQGVNKRRIKEAQQILKDLAEKAKTELTEASSTWVEHPSVIKDESGKVHGLSQEITREQFEKAIQDLISSSREAVDKALKAASLTIDDIDRIILVGGSTKTPMVKKMVEEMFQRDTYADIDPTTVVAQGAAIYAAQYCDIVGEREKTSTILDIVSHFLGIETYGREFSKLIDKGTDLTVEKSARATKTYQTAVDNQEWIRITIFQSPDEIKHIADPGAVCLGEFELGPIPKARAGEKKVDVTFEITSENLLKVSAVLKDESGLTGELEISRSA